MKKDDHKPIGRCVVPESYRESSPSCTAAFRTNPQDEAMELVEASRRLAVGDEVRRLYQSVGADKS